MRRASSVDVFGRNMFVRQLMPALISCLTLSLADMADSIVLGRRMGATALAAVSIVIPIYMVFNVIMHALGLGGSIRYSRLMAEHKKDEARSGYKGVIITAIIIGVIIGIIGNLFCETILMGLGTVRSDGEVYTMASIYFRILACGSPAVMLSYIYNYFLRNDDLEKQAAVSSSVSNILDVLINILFVLILGWGVVGAGIATILGYVIGIVLDAVYIVRGKSNLSFLGVKADFKCVFECFKVGFSNSIWYLGDFAFLIIVNNSLMRSVGYVGVAVFDVVQNISYLYMYLLRAISQASQPIISTYNGERNYKGQRYILSLGLKSAGGLGLIISILVSVFAVGVCKIFGITEQEGLELGKYALFLFCIGGFVSAFSSVYENYAESIEQTKPAYLLSSMRGIFVLIPVTCLCIFLGGESFWMLFPITELVSLLIFRLIYRNLDSLTEEIEEARICRFQVDSDTSKLSKVNEELENFLEKWDVNPKKSYLTMMTLEELCLSVIENGFKDIDGIISITVICEKSGDVRLYFRDNARDFNPFELKTGVLTEDSDETEVATVGLLVIKKKSKFFSYRRYQGFNSLCVVV